MNNLDKFKLDCQEILATDNIGKCLDYLYESFCPLSLKKNQLVLLKARNKRIKDAINGGTVSRMEADIQLNQINENLISLINDLEDTDIIEQQIQDKILVICRTKMVDEMESFFGNRYFPNGKVIQYGNLLPKTKYDIVVLEDMPSLSTSKEELNKYVSSVEAHFLYYGNGRYDPPNEYINKVYFANTRFSLYSRLKELLDYIKYFGK